MYIKPGHVYKASQPIQKIVTTLHHNIQPSAIYTPPWIKGRGKKKKEREIKERNKGKKKKRKKEEKKKPILFHHCHGNKLGLQVLVMPAEEHDHTPSYDV